MKRAYVFVEGQPDADFLKKILPPDAQDDVEIVVAGEGSAVLSLARSFLVKRRVPAVVFQDADTVNPDLLRERRVGAEELIHAAAGTIPAKVILAVPELESYFFHAPELIERVMGRKLPPELIYLGKRDPIGVLGQVSIDAPRKWNTNRAIQLMDALDIEQIRKAETLEELTAFLRSQPNPEEVNAGRSASA